MTTVSAAPDRDPLYQEALATFDDLLRQAHAAGDPEPTAMTLATSVADRVSARIVLLKGVDARGFRFFTNHESAKGEQLAQQPHVALVFHWKTLRNGVQVRVEGRASKLDGIESDKYFASRPRGSQIGAWASTQSHTLESRSQFDARIEDVERRFDGVPVPRPPHWGGYVVAPALIEFWYGADFRLHERQCYERDATGNWSRRMLYP